MSLTNLKLTIAIPEIPNVIDNAPTIVNNADDELPPTTTTQLSSLCDDVLLKIMSYMDAPSILASSVTCRRLRELAIDYGYAMNPRCMDADGRELTKHKTRLYRCFPMVMDCLGAHLTHVLVDQLHYNQSVSPSRANGENFYASIVEHCPRLQHLTLCHFTFGLQHLGDSASYCRNGLTLTLIQCPGHMDDMFFVVKRKWPKLQTFVLHSRIAPNFGVIRYAVTYLGPRKVKLSIIREKAS